jgi:uncharacterized protein (TIGR03435 family)
LEEVGRALGLNADTAQKRVARALEKLRSRFVKRGVTLTATVIAVAVAANSVQAAPVALVKTISVVAVAKGAAATTSTLTLVKGALKLMAWSKAQTAIAVGIGILLVIGTTTVTIKKMQEYKNEEWQLGPIRFETLERAPHKTIILPTKSAKRSRENGTGGIVWQEDGRMMGINESIQSLLSMAYMKYDAAFQDRIILNAKTDGKRYDFISNFPVGSGGVAMQREIKRKFGLTGLIEIIETNVLVLKVKQGSAERLRLSSHASNNSTDFGNGKISAHEETIDDLAHKLELSYFLFPVINQTGLTNKYDFDLIWATSSVSNLKQALLDQLSLELVPTNMPIEMLVVEKVK